MAVDRSGDGECGGANIGLCTVQAGGVPEDHRDVVGVGSGALTLSERDAVVGGASRRQPGHIRDREIRVGIRTERLESDIESGPIAQGHVCGNRSGVSDDRIRKRYHVGGERSGRMSVDVDGNRQVGREGVRLRGTQRVDTRLIGSDIGAVVGEPRGIGSCTRWEGCGRNASSRVTAVGTGEDEVARGGVVGDRHEEVGHPARDHGVRAREDRVGKGERVAGAEQVDRVGVVDERVAGRHPVGRIEGA